MATLIRMPAVLAGADEAAIQTWLVKAGDAVAVGDPLAEVETEKATVEYAAETAGTVLALVAAEGVTIAVGEPIAVVGEPGEDPASALPTDAAPASPGAAVVPQPEPSPVVPEPAALPAFGSGTEAQVDADPAVPQASVARPASGAAGRRFASPLVRRLARERAVDLAAVEGTGPDGRIVRRDLDRVPTPSAPAAPATSAAASARTVPLTAMRRAIARRLTESKTTVPHFYMRADCRVDRLVALRAEANETSPRKLSLNDFVLKAVAAAHLAVPAANAVWAGDAVTAFDGVDVAVAVAVDGGLVTPVLRGVDRLGVAGIAAGVADLADRARARRLDAAALEGGSVSVSNLGMYGVQEFAAILNPPQSLIVAVGAARQAPVVVDGALAVGTLMTVTISVDHRVIDGAVAAEWLAAFQRAIEHPVSLLV